MEKNNLLKIFIPVLAIIVLAESVILISRFNNKSQVAPVVENQPTETKTVTTVTDTNKIFNLNISSDKQSYKVGQEGTVTILMTTVESKSIDAVDLYVDYDPAAVTPTSLVFDKKLPAPSFNKISTTKKLLVANFLITNPTGLNVTPADTVKLMTFKFKAIKAGVTNFEISTGKGTNGSATMIVENNTSKSLSFSSNKLSINVSE